MNLSDLLAKVTNASQISLVCPNDKPLRKGNELRKNLSCDHLWKKWSNFCIPPIRSTRDAPVFGHVSSSWKRVINGKSFFKVWGDQRRGRGLASVYECGGQLRDCRDHRREFTFPQSYICLPSPPPQKKKISWTNANRPAPSSSTISYELGAYHLQKASCFHACFYLFFLLTDGCTQQELTPPWEGQVCEHLQCMQMGEKTFKFVLSACQSIHRASWGNLKKK